jgi:hypothetical protein
MLDVPRLRQPLPGWPRFLKANESDPFSISDCKLRIADCEKKQLKEIRNPNIEIRNKHEFRNSKRSRTSQRLARLVLSFGHLDLFRYSIFDIRI